MTSWSGQAAASSPAAQLPSSQAAGAHRAKASRSAASSRGSSPPRRFFSMMPCRRSSFSTAAASRPPGQLAATRLSHSSSPLNLRAPRRWRGWVEGGVSNAGLGAGPRRGLLGSAGHSSRRLQHTTAGRTGASRRRAAAPVVQALQQRLGDARALRTARPLHHARRLQRLEQLPRRHVQLQLLAHQEQPVAVVLVLVVRSLRHGPSAVPGVSS